MSRRSPVKASSEGDISAASSADISVVEWRRVQCAFMSRSFAARPGRRVGATSMANRVSGTSTSRPSAFMSLTVAGTVWWSSTPAGGQRKPARDAHRRVEAGSIKPRSADLERLADGHEWHLSRHVPELVGIFIAATAAALLALPDGLLSLRAASGLPRTRPRAVLRHLGGYPTTPTPHRPAQAAPQK